MYVHFKPGDCVIYRKQKFSICPGQHARDIHPARNGDYYSYEVLKFWSVVATSPDGQTVRLGSTAHLFIKSSHWPRLPEPPPLSRQNKPDLHFKRINCSQSRRSTQ
jgi:hypothetical protein